MTNEKSKFEILQKNQIELNSCGFVCVHSYDYAVHTEAGNVCGRITKNEQLKK